MPIHYSEAKEKPTTSADIVGSKWNLAPKSIGAPKKRAAMSIHAINKLKNTWVYFFLCLDPKINASSM